MGRWPDRLAARRAIGIHADIPPKSLSLLDSTGFDIGPLVEAAAARHDIPVTLALACGQAESGWHRLAERWGTRAAVAKAAIEAQDWPSLQAIIDATKPDISFSYGQRIIRYHYHGDRSETVANCLAVRQYVFANPAEDIDELCRFLYPRLIAAQGADLSPVDGDVLLMALVAYNRGSPAPAWHSYWTEYSGHVERYREALAWARGLVVEAG